MSDRRGGGVAAGAGYLSLGSSVARRGIVRFSTRRCGPARSGPAPARPTGSSARSVTRARRIAIACRVCPSRTASRPGAGRPRSGFSVRAVASSDRRGRPAPASAFRSRTRSSRRVDVVRLPDAQREPGQAQRRAPASEIRAIGIASHRGSTPRMTRLMSAAAPTVSVVIPNWNGRAGCRAAWRRWPARTGRADEVIVVDNGSSDGSVDYLRAEPTRRSACSSSAPTPASRTPPTAASGARAASSWRSSTPTSCSRRTGSRGWRARSLATRRRRRWPARCCRSTTRRGLRRRRRAAARRRLRAARALRARRRPLGRPGRGVRRLRRRGAVSPRLVLRALGGFDERYFAYLEDVDLALRLPLAGWRCRYEPASRCTPARAPRTSCPAVTIGWWHRNTLLLVAKAFPARWLPYVALPPAGVGLARRCASGACASHLRGLAAAVPMLPAAVAEPPRSRRRRAGLDRAGGAGAPVPRSASRRPSPARAGPS